MTRPVAEGGRGTGCGERLEGGCDCGQVRYRLLAPPLIVHCCHCRWCQRESGAAFAVNAVIEADRLQVLGAGPVLVDTPTDSGAGQQVARCPHCQVAVWSHYPEAGPLTCFVRVGTLDRAAALPPDVHIYVRSRLPWVTLPAGARFFDAYYDRDQVWSPDALRRWRRLATSLAARRAAGGRFGGLGEHVSEDVDDPSQTGPETGAAKAPAMDPMTARSSRRLWDISPPVHAGAPVFPGDTSYRQKWVATIGPGCPVNVSELTLSPHIGAHADAPLHYDPAGTSIGDTDLAPYIGPCRVIHAIDCGPLIEWRHLVHAIDDGLPPRVLVRTYARMPVDAWDPGLSAYAAETVERLAALGVQLIGIDTASIDPADSKRLPSHQAIRRHDLRVLENLVLDEVDEGDYELIALPLKLVTADASPVRAVLLSR